MMAMGYELGNVLYASLIAHAHCELDRMTKDLI
jgi:hypothetical protein